MYYSTAIIVLTRCTCTRIGVESKYLITNSTNNRRDSVVSVAQKKKKNPDKRFSIYISNKCP